MIPVQALKSMSPKDRATVLERPSVLSEKVMASAKRIIDDVRRGRDKTLRKLTKKFDGVDLDSIAVPASAFEAAESRLSEAVRIVIRSARDSIARYHKEGLLKSFEFEPTRGITLGKLAVPFETAGLYVPGGRAVYPSCVLMAGVPAQVAGVRRIVLCTPPDRAGKIPDTVLFAASLCGITDVFPIGGAQAIAAMAYGTESVPACRIIAGPGNAYVTAAKKLVQNDVAIDFLAGPSEILIVSDGETNPAWIAAEMMAQAEHDPEARSVLVTVSADQAKAVCRELDLQVPGQDREEIMRKALAKHGAVLVVDTLDEALEFANEYAAEHLTLSCRNPVPLLKKIRDAGAIFLGEYSPVAVGDYGVGPNSTLPTLGDARLRSGLDANTFLKTISYEMLSPEGLDRVAPTVLSLARIEGLPAHGRSVQVRLKK